MIQRFCIYYFKKNGWRFLGTIPKKERTVVLLYGPQTSWRELVLAIAVKSLTYFNVEVLVEKSAWSWKSSWLLNAAGATSFVPKSNEVQQDKWSEMLKSDGPSALAFPLNPLHQPTGARYTHFYDIALKCNAMVVLVAFDFRKKVIKFHSPFRLSGYQERDMSYINGFFAPYYRQILKAP